MPRMSRIRYPARGVNSVIDDEQTEAGSRMKQETTPYPRTAERIERLPVSRHIWTWIVLIAIGTFWDSYMLFSVGPISSHYFAYLGQSGYATELPLMLFLGTFIGAVTLSSAADRIGRRNAFAVDLCLLAVGDLIAVFSPNATVLMIALLIAGFGTGAELPLSTTYTQELTPAHRRGRITSVQLTIGFCGGTVGGLVSAALVPVTVLGVPGFKIVLLLAAVGGLSSLIIRRGLPESPRWLERVGRLDEAERAMSRVERLVMRDQHLPALPEPKDAPQAQQPRQPVLTLLSRRYLRRTFSAWFIELFQGFGSYGFTTFVPLVLYGKGYSIVHALAFTAIIQIAYPVGCALSIFVTDRVERKWGMTLFYTLNVLSGIGFFFSNSTGLIILFGFLTEMLIFMSGRLLHTYEAEIYPTALRGTGAGVSYSLSRLGGFLAPLAASCILAIGGGSGGSLLIGVASGAWLLCAIVAGTATIKTTGRTLEGLEAPSAVAPGPAGEKIAADYAREDADSKAAPSAES